MKSILHTMSPPKKDLTFLVKVTIEFIILLNYQSNKRLNPLNDLRL